MSTAIVRSLAKHPAAESSDSHIVAACLRGDSLARAELCQRYKRRVFGIVFGIVGVQEAEEVCQEAFIKIFRGLSKFRGDSKLSTWIYRLSVNTALTHLSKSKRRKEVSMETVCLTEPKSSYQGDPYLRQRLTTALAQISPGYRAVIVLHDMQGLSHEECAKILGCRVGTSKSQLHKARAKMRTLLAPLQAESLA